MIVAALSSANYVIEKGPSLRAMTHSRPGTDVDIPTGVQELLAAYRTLGLAPQASPAAVRVRYRELTQVAAAERVREIDAAFDLVKDAPLQNLELPAEPASEPETAPASRPHWLTRVDIDPLVCFNFSIGMGTGRVLGYWLGGPLRDPLYAWLLAIAMGIVFARTSWVAHWLIRAIVGALRLGSPLDRI